MHGGVGPKQFSCLGPGKFHVKGPSCTCVQRTQPHILSLWLLPATRVGALLLRGEWQEAVRQIMLPRADARQEVWAASKAYLEGDNIEQAVKLLPKNGGSLSPGTLDVAWSLFVFNFS